MEKFRDTIKAIPPAVEALSWKNVKKVLGWLVPLVAGLFLVFNYLTGYLYFNRVNLKIDVLERIELKAQETYYSDLIEKEYAEILNEVQEYELRKIRLSVREVTIDISDWLLKLLASLILPVGLLLVSLREPDLKMTFIGIGIFSAVFGTIAVLIPTIYTPGLSAIIVILLEIIVLMWGKLRFS